MAVLTNNSSGNFTTVATWSVIDPTSLLDSEVSASQGPVAFTSSSAFTPGAITIDGIGLKVQNRIPAGTGTISVRLALAGIAVAGTTVTINVVDLPSASQALSMQGWAFFKFTSPVTLMAAMAYTLQIMTSASAVVTILRDGTANNWSRYLRTTTTQAPAATDTLYVTGEYTGPGTGNTLTVTMDNTSATVFGKLEISGNGILSYGTAASTNYQLICNGNFLVNGAGSLRVGTSGTRIPATSTAVLQINQGGVNVTNTFSNRGTGDIQTWGNNKTWRTTLAANAAAAATTLTSAVATGWTTGENIVIGSTTITVAQTELKTLAVNSSGTTITVPALSFAHDGTAPTAAEIANITRNVKIRGESVTLQAYMQAAADGTINHNDAEFQFFGSGTANKRGFDIFPIAASTGTLNIKDCAFKNWEVVSSLFLFNQATNDRCIVDGCVFYRMSGTAMQTGSTTTTGITWTNCWAFSNVAAGNVGFLIASQGGTFTNLRAISQQNNGFNFSGVDNVGMVVNNLIAHSNGATGATISQVSISENYTPFSDITVWRNNTRGLHLSTAARCSIDVLFLQTVISLNGV